MQAIDTMEKPIPGAAPALAARSVESRRWHVVAWLTAGIIIAYADRINLSSALPVIRESIPLSPAQSGLVLSAFFWSYAALHIPAGWVVDRFGVRRTYAAAIFFWSLVSAATALVSTVGGLITLRVLLGIGESVTVPASMRYIRTNFAEKERGLAVGVLMAGTKYGPAIGAPLATYLVLSHGWQWMFVLMGMAGLLWLVPWLFITRNDAALVPAQQPSAGYRSTQPAVVSWRAVLSTPVVWGTFIGTFCYNYFVYFCMTWMPTYFKETHGLSLTDSGWFTFMSFSGMATIAILGGWLADRCIARGYNPVTIRRGFTMGGFVLALSVVGGAFTTTASLSLFLSVFSLCGLGLATANYWALTQTLVPGSVAARVAGIQNTAASSAGIAAPWITGHLIQQTGDFNAPLMAIGVWLVLGLGSYAILVREKYALV
jgi:ACS family D-galactonate transporter-like MFS transporter